MTDPEALTYNPAQMGFLDQLASELPAPAGGSAAAFTAASAAALVTKTARLTIGRIKYAHVEEKMRALIERAETLRRELTCLVAIDAQVYRAYLAAIKLPAGTPEKQEKRDQLVSQARLRTAEIPLQVSSLALQVLEASLFAAREGNKNLLLDAGASATLAWASIQITAKNVKANLRGVENSSADSLRERSEDISATAARLVQEMEKIVMERMGA